MLLIENSNKACVVNDPPIQDEIHVVMQYFIHSSPVRDQELKTALRLLCENSLITKIHLLNERIYDTEKGEILASEKIIQIDIGTRVKFKDVFAYLRKNEIRGYHVILNSDICLDETVANLRTSDIHLRKKMFSQLRFEYDPEDIKQSKIYGPKHDSQDTWIFHSNFSIPEQCEKMFNFKFGIPGCDNKMIYLMRMMGYEVINDPEFVKTYHVHASEERNYTTTDRLGVPYALISPAGIDVETLSYRDLRQDNAMTRPYDDVGFDDNRILYEYIQSKVSKSERFVIPRIAGHENNYAGFGRIIKETGGNMLEGLADYFQKTIPVMKNNAGIKISGVSSIIQYSDMYLGAFENCDLYAGWEAYGHYIGHIKQSHEFIRSWYSKKKIFWAFAFDIFHYIYSVIGPWTHALKGKRLLIISPFEDSFREKLDIRAKIYHGVDLFPDCSFEFIKPPQTQGDEPSDEFTVELERFWKRLDKMKDKYDIALVSCGGYGNLVCNHIYNSGRSAIYVGGVLQMYFGVLGARWLRERPDVVRLFLNEHWSRPKESEKPKNYANVEGSCYW